MAAGRGGAPGMMAAGTLPRPVRSAAALPGSITPGSGRGPSSQLDAGWQRLEPGEIPRQCKGIPPYTDKRRWFALPALLWAALPTSLRDQKHDDSCKHRSDPGVPCWRPASRGGLAGISTFGALAQSAHCRLRSAGTVDVAGAGHGVPRGVHPLGRWLGPAARAQPVPDPRGLHAGPRLAWRLLPGVQPGAQPVSAARPR